MTRKKKSNSTNPAKRETPAIGSALGELSLVFTPKDAEAVVRVPVGPSDPISVVLTLGVAEDDKTPSYKILAPFPYTRDQVGLDQLAETLIAVADLLILVDPEEVFADPEVGFEDQVEDGDGNE